eukprot:m.144930 g.144930  ORF g.144930 m.144930 type:complete len:145 (-) comp24262_c1_seq3:62-496(-)
MTDENLMDRVFVAIAQGNENYISKDEFVCGMSVFLRGTAPPFLDCFQIYDLNGDGHIVREEMFHLLRSTIVKPQSEEDRDEGIKDLVDLVLKKMDHDHDGRLSKSDYETSVKNDSLLLEAFGQCLPSPKVRIWVETLKYGICCG